MFGSKFLICYIFWFLYNATCGERRGGGGGFKRYRRTRIIYNTHLVPSNATSQLYDISSKWNKWTKFTNFDSLHSLLKCWTWLFQLEAHSPNFSDLDRYQTERMIVVFRKIKKNNKKIWHMPKKGLHRFTEHQQRILSILPILRKVDNSRYFDFMWWYEDENQTRKIIHQNLTHNQRKRDE